MDYAHVPIALITVNSRVYVQTDIYKKENETIVIGKTFILKKMTYFTLRFRKKSVVLDYEKQICRNLTKSHLFIISVIRFTRRSKLLLYENYYYIHRIESVQKI